MLSVSGAAKDPGDYDVPGTDLTLADLPLYQDVTRLHNLLYLTVSLGWLSLAVDLLMTIIKHYCCKLVTVTEDADDWNVNNKFWEESLFFEALKYKSVGKIILSFLYMILIAPKHCYKLCC